MSPLTHIEEGDEVDTLDDVRTLLAAVDAAEAMLTDAVANHDAEAIATAQEQIEHARADMLRAESRQRDLVRAEAAAKKLAVDAKKAEHRALADTIETKLRKRSPEIRFEASRGRVVIVRLAGTHLEVQYAAECTRRLAMACALSCASQILASRDAGKIVRAPEWLDNLMTSESGGIAIYLKSGICRIEEEK